MESFKNSTIIHKINLLNKSSFFFIFFSFIFLTRLIFVNYSFSEYPWFFEWEIGPYLIEIKNSDYSFLKEYSISANNQFAIFTKFLYLAIFKIFGNNWHPLNFAVVSQLVNSIYLSLFITFLFHKKIKSILVIFFIFIFVSIPHSLTTYYHFSEIGYYFQILIPIFTFYLFREEKNLSTQILLLSFIFVVNFLNMEMAALILQYSLIFFFLYKFIIYNKKKHLYLLIYSIALVFIHYFLIYKTFFGPALNDGSNTVDKDFFRSLYLLFIKSPFSPLSFTLLIGFTSLIFFYEILIKQKNYKFKNLEFLVLPLIFISISIIAISFNRVQIYDRYRDLYALGGILSIFFLNYIDLNKYKIQRICIAFLILVVLVNNEVRFFIKLIEHKKISYAYDKEIKKQIDLISADKNYEISTESNNKIIKEVLNRYGSIIKLSVSNKIIE